MPRKDSVISSSNSYLDSKLDKLHAATANIYADGNGLRLVSLGTIALFSKYKSTTSSGEPLGDISRAHIDSLMYKLITSAEYTGELSFGFDRDRARRQRELSHKENQKRKFSVRITLKHVLGFPEHQKKRTYGSGYKLTFTRSSYNSVLKKANATNNAKIKPIGFE